MLPPYAGQSAPACRGDGSAIASLSGETGVAATSSVETRGMRKPEAAANNAAVAITIKDFRPRGLNDSFDIRIIGQTSRTIGARTRGTKAHVFRPTSHHAQSKVAIKASKVEPRPFRATQRYPITASDKGQPSPRGSREIPPAPQAPYAPPTASTRPAARTIAAISKTIGPEAKKCLGRIE